MTAPEARRRAAQEVLERRARALARPVEPERHALLEVVVFSIGDRRFAAPTRDLREVATGCRLARVPDAPPSLLGVMNLRGQLLPVFSLLAADPEPGARECDRVVVLGDERPLGIAVDDVGGVSEVDPAELVPPPRVPDDEHLPRVRGLTPDGISLLDVAALLEDVRSTLSPPPTRTEPR